MFSFLRQIPASFAFEEKWTHFLFDICFYVTLVAYLMLLASFVNNYLAKFSVIKYINSYL
jgi:hypothetical protein